MIPIFNLPVLLWQQPELIPLSHTCTDRTQQSQVGTSSCTQCDGNVLSTLLCTRPNVMLLLRSTLDGKGEMRAEVCGSRQICLAVQSDSLRSSVRKAIPICGASPPVLCEHNGKRHAARSGGRGRWSRPSSAVRAAARHPVRQGCPPSPLESSQGQEPRTMACADTSRGKGRNSAGMSAGPTAVWRGAVRKTYAPAPLHLQVPLQSLTGVELQLPPAGDNATSAVEISGRRRGPARRFCALAACAPGASVLAAAPVPSSTAHTGYAPRHPSP